ncbi:MAG: hypothetical protein N7Q72_04465, partial [Spiroplasma sp. Tabriz.8]|nr:hypothetical protein [Spiroplasma sp. Tabriz.8]
MQNKYCFGRRRYTWFRNMYIYIYIYIYILFFFFSNINNFDDIYSRTSLYIDLSMLHILRSFL